MSARMMSTWRTLKPRRVWTNSGRKTRAEPVVFLTLSTSGRGIGIMATDQDEDYSMEELTLSQAAKEFKINRGTLNNWLHQGKIPARKEFGELGIQYYLVKR